jgi:ADP-heptose:LPS heptosyltransferase
MHIAAALGIRCVACFGSTSAELTGPYGPPGRHIILQSQCPQAPCFKRVCPRLCEGVCCPQGVTSATAATAVCKCL